MADETGEGQGEGFTLNIPSPPGFGDGEYIEIVEKQVVPAIASFAPDILFISAGFDAHRDDPLASMRVTEGGFGKMTRLLKHCAQQCCKGRLVSALEGGYNLNALALSVEQHLSALCEQ